MRVSVLSYTGFSIKERTLKKHGQAIRLWSVTGIFLVNLLLFAVASAEPIPPSEGKGPASQTQTHTGIDVSELTELDALGFLSLEKVKPWGHLFADETERMLLARGDTVYVAFEKEHRVKPGDLFTVFHTSSQLDHPLTGRDLGYVVSFLGRVVLKKEVKPHLFKAEIVECYSPMQVGDPIIGFEPVSPCIRLCSPEWEKSPEPEGLKVPVVAAKDLNQVIGQFSVLYLDHGHKHGIHRGNLFQIVTHAEHDQPKEPPLPDQVLGYLLVLEARPTTSTGLVMTAKRELFSGIMLKAIDIKHSLKELLTRYGIQHEDAELDNDPLRVLDSLREEAGSKTDLPEAFLLLSKLPKCRIN